MSLRDLQGAVNGGKYVATRVQPPFMRAIGASVPVLRVEFKGDQLAWAEDGLTSWVVRAYRIGEVVHLDRTFSAVLAQEFPPVIVKFRPAVGDEVRSWDDAAHEHDDDDEEIARAARTAVEGKLPTTDSVPTKTFTYVEWYRFSFGDGKLVPVGVALRATDGSLETAGLQGFEEEAEALRGRFAVAPKDWSETINGVADRTSSFSAPLTIKALDERDAIDRALYNLAKEHFHQTGIVLL